MTISYNNVVTCDRTESCNLFADFFGSVFLPDDVLDCEPGVVESELHVGTLRISLAEVFEELLKLNVNKGPGPDLIPNLFLKNTIYGIAQPLYILFNKSLTTGTFPTAWKNSRVTPVFKSGDKSNVENYRPISILDAIPKFFEKLVTRQMMALIRSVIVDEQHGFLDKRSTVTNLAIIQHFISGAIENRSQLDVIYTDFAKAFDRVSHKVLAAKLEKMGIVNPLLSWLGSYLCDRKQVVHIDGCKSSVISVTSGVPQGSHLGPLLFILFINDLPLVLKHCQILLYADDAKLFAQVDSVEDVCLVQEDLNSFVTWCEDNHMSVNASKCKVVRYTRKKDPVVFGYVIGDSVVSAVSDITDLGVTFSADGRFHEHVIKTVNKALRILGFVNRNFDAFKLPSTYVTLFNSLVRPILEYGSPVWSSYTGLDTRLVESVQSKFLRKLAYLNKTPLSFDNHNYTEIKQLFHVRSLGNRRIIFDLIFLFKTLNNLIDCPFILSNIGIHVPARALRENRLFDVPTCRTAIAENSLFNRITRYGNDICADIDLFDVTHTKFLQFLYTRY